MHERGAATISDGSSGGLAVATPPVRLPSAPEMGVPVPERETLSLRAWREAWAPLLLLALVLLMFGDVLLGPGGRVLSRQGADLSEWFAPWREFAFRELRHGRLPLWNPHLFGGVPCLGGFQAALLYPPNWLYLLLPLDRGINLEIALHVFLGGWFTYLWTRNRGLHPAASLTAAAVLMFCGPFFLRIYAGHLAPLDAMAWTPLLLLAADRLVEEEGPGPVLLGIAAGALQILAGHPQTVFNTALTVGLYAGGRGLLLRRHARALLGLAAFYGGAAALAAAQLLPGLQAAGEGARHGAVPYEFAATFSFPPESLLTLAAPGFFGDMARLQYWGRTFPWEVSLYVGAAAGALALYGALCSRGRERGLYAFLFGTLVVLALGSQTPLFPWLYRFVPGFNKFRGSGKFLYPAALFLAGLAALGLDDLIRRPGASRAAARLALAGGLAAGLFGAWLRWGDAAGLARRLRAVTAMENCLPVEPFQDPAFAGQAARFAGEAVLVAAGITLLLALLFHLRQRSRFAAFAAGGVALVEVFAFAHGNRPQFELAASRSPEVGAYLAARPGDYRVRLERHPNRAMTLPADDVWGYDPGVLRRYKEFVAYTQGLSPDTPVEAMGITRSHPLFRLLRLRYTLTPREDGFQVTEARAPLPRLLLLRDTRVLTGRDRILKALDAPGFDPARTVILETAPDPAPDPRAAGGRVRLLRETSDSLEIEADLPAPAVLLVTDTYSTGWRATPLPGSAQRDYRVLPADYMLRAVPLAAGRHHLRLAYLPSAFVAGAWISVVSLLGYVVVLGLYLRQVVRW